MTTQRTKKQSDHRNSTACHQRRRLHSRLPIPTPDSCQWKYHSHRGRVHRQWHDLCRECETGSYSLRRYVPDECLTSCEPRGNHLTGSLKTPQVLELSGVGNATILQNAGVCLSY
ncbi:hypothetical protein OG21DRAFT_910056 [Imleria badia]|nr:hypothetical protein OG21DRAFT_910056 [Imleria badia]